MMMSLSATGFHCYYHQAAIMWKSLIMRRIPRIGGNEPGPGCILLDIFLNGESGLELIDTH